MGICTHLGRFIHQSIIIFTFPLLMFLVASSSAEDADPSHCAKALSAVNQYVAANRQLTAGRFNSGGISGEAYEQRLIEFDDIEASVSMGQCLSGEKTALYQCLTEQQGDYVLCRQRQ